MALPLTGLTEEPLVTPKTTRGGARVTQMVRVPIGAHRLLSILTEYQRAIYFEKAKREKAAAMRIVPARSPTEWAQTADGRKVFEDLVSQGRAHEFDIAYQQYMKGDFHTHGINKDTQFPLPNCMGDVLQRILDKYGDAILREIEEEYAGVKRR